MSVSLSTYIRVFYVGYGVGSPVERAKAGNSKGFEELLELSTQSLLKASSSDTPEIKKEPQYAFADLAKTATCWSHPGLDDDRPGALVTLAAAGGAALAVQMMATANAVSLGPPGAYQVGEAAYDSEPKER